MIHWTCLGGKMFYLVCFDIVDNPVRYRVVKILKGYGVRVQKSVFECPNLTEHRFLKMKSALEGVMDHLEDTIRYYLNDNHVIMFNIKSPVCL